MEQELNYKIDERVDAMRQYLLNDFKRLISNAQNSLSSAVDTRPQGLNSGRYKNPDQAKMYNFLSEELSSVTSPYYKHKKSFCLRVVLSLFIENNKNNHNQFVLDTINKCSKLIGKFNAYVFIDDSVSDDDLFNRGFSFDIEALSEIQSEISYLLNFRDIKASYDSLCSLAEQIVGELEESKQDIDMAQDSVSSYCDPEIQEYTECINILSTDNAEKMFDFMGSIYSDNKTPQCICGRCGAEIDVKNALFSRVPREAPANLLNFIPNLTSYLLRSVVDSNFNIDLLHQVYAPYGCVKPVVCQNPECHCINIVSGAFLLFFKASIITKVRNSSLSNECIVFHSARTIEDYITGLEGDNLSMLRNEADLMKPAIIARNAKPDLLKCDFKDMFTSCTYSSYFSSLNMQKDEVLLGNEYERISRFLYMCASKLGLSYDVSVNGFLASLMSWSEPSIRSCAETLSHICKNYMLLRKIKIACSVITNILDSGCVDTLIEGHTDEFFDFSHLDECFDTLIQSLMKCSMYQAPFSSFKDCIITAKQRYESATSDKFKDNARMDLYTFLKNCEKQADKSISDVPKAIDNNCERFKVCIYSKLAADCNIPGQKFSPDVLLQFVSNTDSMPFVENTTEATVILSSGLAETIFEHFREFYPIFLSVYLIKSKTFTNFYYSLFALFNLKKKESTVETLLTKIFDCCRNDSATGFVLGNGKTLPLKSLAVIKYNPEPFMSSDELDRAVLGEYLDSLLETCRYGNLSYFLENSDVDSYAAHLAFVDSYNAGDSDADTDASTAHIAEIIYKAATGQIKPNKLE